MVKIFGQVPPPLTMDIFEVLVDNLFLVVNAFVMNESRGYWFLTNALFIAITMKSKLKEELDNLMEEDVVIVIELNLLISNIKREVCNVLDIFFLKKFDERKTHNMLALMLDPRYKNLTIVFTFVGKVLGVVVKEYDKKALFLMLLKTH
jgi:hypothetical protein